MPPPRGRPFTFSSPQVRREPDATWMRPLSETETFGESPNGSSPSMMSVPVPVTLTHLTFGHDAARVMRSIPLSTSSAPVDSTRRANANSPLPVLENVRSPVTRQFSFVTRPVSSTRR